MKRDNIKQIVKREGIDIERAMRIPKGKLTHKQRAFAEGVARGETGSDAYRAAYKTRAKPRSVGNAANALKGHAGIAREIARIEQANELSALHSAEGLRSIVISTLTSIATDPDEKGSTRVQAVRSIGQLVGVDAFRETKRIERVQDSGDIRKQILEQLRGITINSDTGSEAEVNSLLGELVDEIPQGDGINLVTGTTGEPPHPLDMGAEVSLSIHSIPLEQSQAFSDKPFKKDPPTSFENGTPGGDIFLEKDDIID